MEGLMDGLILCNHLKMPTHIHKFFKVMFNHDKSQVDYLGYKVLFIMNDGQTYTHTNTHTHKHTHAQTHTHTHTQTTHTQI